MKIKTLSVLSLIGLFLFMLISPETVTTGAANGLLLWYRRVLPVLFPFLLITGLMIRTGSISMVNRILSPVLMPFLGISGNASFSVVCGFLCGFPVGAKSCSDLTCEEKISSSEGEYLLSFCNNVSPAFLSGYVASQCLGMKERAQICLLLPILAALCCSFLFRRWYSFNCFPHSENLFSAKRPYRNFTLARNPHNTFTQTKSLSKTSAPAREISLFPNSSNQPLPFAEALDESILSACDSITRIGGYMIAFSVLLAFMEKLSFQNPLWKHVLLPGMELTGGIRMLCQADLSSDLRFLLVMAHCSFGGICALFQTKCMIRSQSWSFFRYTTEKLITAMVTSLFAFCYLKLFC